MEIGHEETEADITRTLDRVYHPPRERNPFSYHLDVTGQVKTTPTLYVAEKIASIGLRGFRGDDG
jgi:hypothetical protein